MGRSRKIFWGKTAAIMGALPLLIWAHSAGPDPGRAGVPGEATCAMAGCHTGTPVNGGGGNVAVTFPFGPDYVPGVKQHWVVTVTDTVQKHFGFQLTARQTPVTVQAGTFTSTDQNTAVTCGPTSLDPNQEIFLDFGANQTCPATKPMTYIEHTLAGSSRIQAGQETYEFDWTPPQQSVGNITVYVAANAVNWDGTVNGDHVYTASYTLTPATGGGVGTPTISAVFNAAGYQSGVYPGSFISIQGSNLSPVSYADWSNSIANGKLPGSLSGVTVTIAGKPAYIYQMIPGQINAQAPDVGYGSMQVTITTPSGTSPPFTVNSQEFSPAFWQWPNNQPVATHGDYSIAAKNGTFTGTTTIPAKPGEIITLWGTGFGPVSPAVPAGQLPGSSAGSPTANPVTVTLNNGPVTVIGAALSPYPADYQVAIQIPASIANGDYPLVASVNGVSSPTMTLSVHQ